MSFKVFDIQAAEPWVCDVSYRLSVSSCLVVSATCYLLLLLFLQVLLFFIDDIFGLAQKSVECVPVQTSTVEDFCLFG